MKLKLFLAVALIALFLVQIFIPPVQATNNECTQQNPCRGIGRRDA